MKLGRPRSGLIQIVPSGQTSQLDVAELEAHQLLYPEDSFLPTHSSVVLLHRRVKGHCYFCFTHAVHCGIRLKSQVSMTSVFMNVSYLAYLRINKLSD